MFCQICGTSNEDDREYCRRCHQKLLVISGLPTPEDYENFEGGQEEPFSLDEHLLERISILEEVVKRQAETVRRTLETLYRLEQKILIGQTGVTTLRDLLEDKRVIAREEWSELWEERMDSQLLALEKRESFAAVKGQIAVLYRGDRRSAFLRLLDDAEAALLGLDIDRALAILEKAHGQDPTNHELSFFLGEVFFNEGDEEAAVNYFERVLAVKPHHFEGLVYSGVLQHELGQKDRAEELLLRAVEQYPETFLASFSLGAIYASEGRLAEAVQLLTEAVDAEAIPQARLLLGRCYYEMGKPGRTIGQLEKALDVDPTLSGAHDLLALAYLERRWSKKARSALAEALRLRPPTLDYDDLKGLLTLDTRESEESKAVESWQRGDRLLGEGRAREALSAYRRALAIEPDNPELLVAYAMVCLELGRDSEVEGWVEKALALDPEDRLRVGAYATLIEALRSEGKWHEGYRLARLLLAEATSDLGRTVAYHAMATNLAETDEDLDEALDFASRALELAPEGVRHLAQAAVGWVHFKRHELDQSIHFLDCAQAGIHDDRASSARILTQLGMVLLTAGHRERAREVLHRAQDLRWERAKFEDRVLDVLKDGARLLQDPPINP